MIRSLSYNIKQGFMQVFRNRGMSFVSVFSITAILLILGLFFVIMVNINQFTEVLKQDYDQIEVYLLDSTSYDEAQELMNKIENKDGVEEVDYRTKEEALDTMKERWGDSSYLLESLGENPLPNSILISAKSLEDTGGIAKYANSLDGVENIQYYQETVQKLTSVTNFLQIASLVIMGFLVIVSIVVVSNTVKLTVFARAKEISIMKYVGATNWFIRGPFLAEGVIIGIVAALVSSIFVMIFYSNLVSLIGDQVLTIISYSLISASNLAAYIIIMFLTLGATVGGLGSIVSMHKFLDV